MQRCIESKFHYPESDYWIFYPLPEPPRCDHNPSHDITLRLTPPTPQRPLALYFPTDACQRDAALATLVAAWAELSAEIKARILVAVQEELRAKKG
jgi:hypothetical protein